MNKKYNCVLLVARNHGLETLETIKKLANFEIRSIFTHQFEPKSSEKKEREDFNLFLDLSKQNNVPFHTINEKKENYKLKEFIEKESFDFLISVSWRYWISPDVFKKAKIGAFNIHRGNLPEYAGAEPIKRALLNQEKYIFITSHKINETIDGGEVLCKRKHLTNYDSAKSLDDNVKRLLNEITPHFSELTSKSLNMYIENCFDNNKSM